MKLTIEQNDSGKRLDNLLTRVANKYSRNQIQKFIKQGLVLVNGKIVAPHCFLKNNDKIIFEEKKITQKKSIAQSILKPLKKFIKKNDNFSNIEIIDETKDYLIINKPTGLIVHGAEHIKKETLTDYLVSKYPNIKKVGDDPARPGIVHRLDKEASGLMIIAKNQTSFIFFKNIFKKRLIKKNYTALVHGKIIAEEDKINFPIKRSSSGFKMAALPLTNKKEQTTIGREALTEFTIAKRFVNYTLLKLNIKTGRTHQIRVHLSAYGHPVVGDDLYSTKKTKEQNKKLNLKRIFLVASSLSFTDVDGQQKKYSVSLPEELEQLLKIVK